jgi:Tfp pilus assembly protein PilP
VKRLGLVMVALALALAERPVGAAGTESTEARPVAPTMGGVKDVVRGAAKEAAGKVMGGPAATTAAPTTPQDPAARATLLRKKTLRDDDFVDADDRNRDPFRSYLRLFTAKEGPKTPKVPAIFDKFALEELTLIGIVSGDANPRAMFRDPSGLGLTLKRGDYLSKIGARVSKILSDRVVLELNEVSPTGETRVLEKAVLVNPEGMQK